MRRAVTMPRRRAGCRARGARLLRAIGDARRLEPVVAESLAHVPTGAIEDVDTAPVDELEDTDRRIAEAHAGSERAVHVLGRGHALLDQAHRLVHQQHLDARPDEARRVRAAYRGLAEP